MDLLYKKQRKLSKPTEHNRIRSAGLKLLSVALFAGCSLISGQAVAAETDVFTPTLDRLHNDGVKIPGSDEIYPESEYTVTEIFPSDTNNLAPNVIKYYDPNSTGDSAHYYEVNLKNSVYGEGSSQKYYKWEKDSNGVKLTETTDSSEAVLTIKFNPGENFTQVHTPEGATLSVVNEIYVGGNIKKLIANKGTVNSISSKFIENTIEVNASDTYDYSAVMSEYGANIKNINSSFIGNEVNIDAAGKTIYGPLVKSLSKIGNINSEFVANRVTSNTNLNGGLIEVAASASIDNITSDFLLNNSIVNGANLDGGVISNEGTIGGINSSVFVGNYGITDSGNINGAVINNSGTITDGINSSVFNGNYGKTSSGTAKGGAIYNAYQMSVTNSIFAGNYVESETGQAYGGAIYTDSNLTINATDGKTTEFTGNYVINNGVRDNQAIYVDSATATLTLSAVNNGKILLNDNINGAQGYRVDLTTDETGTIYLYNNINNAGVTATNANINMADGNYFDYDFLSLYAGSGGKFTIDADFESGKADTFTLGNNSNGTIYINDINLIGNIPTVEKTIQLLTGPDTISVELSQNLIDKYHKVTQGTARYEVDNINTNSKWSDIYNGHVYQDTITEGIRTAISDTGRTTADSIEYYITTETTESVKQIGATFALMNREVSGTRSFSANSAQDIYTVKENLGKSAAGTLNVVGAKDGDTLATIDVNGRTMMELVYDNTRVNFSNINIINPKNETGSVLKITNPTAGAYFSGDITISTGSETAFDGIVNNGTLTITSERNNNTFTSDTGITGTGRLNISGLGPLDPSNVTFTNGASIIQELIDISNGSLDLSNGGSITGDISIGGASKLIVNASNLHDSDHSIPIFYGSTLELTGGTLNDNITTGGARAYLNISGDVTNNAEIYVLVNGRQPESSLTTSATLLKANVESMENLVITGGEQNYDLKGKNITITGDVVNNNGVINASNQFYLAEGATLTTTIDKIASMHNSKTVDGTLNLVGGSMGGYYDISGTGTINILKDTQAGSSYTVGNIYIKDGVTFTANATTLQATNIVNDGVIIISGQHFNGNLTKNGITGSGYIVINNNVNNYTMDIHQKILINEGKTLNINADRIFAPVETNGKLIVSGDRMSLDYDVTGDGVTSFEGGTRYLTSNIYTDLVNVPGTLVVASDLLNTTKSITNNGTLHLTSGTTNKAIGGTGNLFILADQNVILNALVSNTIYLDAGSTLTISADNLGKSVARLNPNSTLNLLSGTLKQNISNGNGSIVNIAGDVTVEDVVLQPNVHVNEDGTLTANSKNLFGSIDNDGSLYLSGDLGNRKVTGSGITYIDKELTFDNNNSGISEGGLNLNNGTLVISNNSFATSSVGTLSGTGNLIFDVSWDNVDKLSLNSNSDGVVKIDASKLNYINLPNFDTPTNSAILQVLVGGSNARLELVNNTIQQSLQQEAYDTAMPDVFFDDPFYKYITEGLLTGTIKLANTTSANDSIQFLNVSTIWDEQQKQPGALLHSWNVLNTDEERHFRFKTASDTYTALQDIGDTTPGKLTIHGVASEDGSLKSAIEMNNQSGFVLNGNSNLNIENVKFTNLKDYFIDLKNSAASLGSLDEDGNPVGGLINVTIDTMNVEETSSNDLLGTVIKSQNSATIAQIKDSTFKNINVIKNSTDKVTNRNLRGGLFYIYSGGEKLSAGIINSEISNNTITFNTPDSAGNFILGGLVQLGGKAKLDTISGKFNYNTMTAKNALYGGVFNFDSSVNKIIDSEFIGNTIIGLGNHNDIEGAAIRLSAGNSIKIIDNVLFKNNTAINDNGNRTSFGGAIMSYGTGLGDINNSRFINNTAGQGGAIWSNHSIGSITNSLFQGNSAFKEAGALFIKENVGSINEISHTQFIENYALENSAGAVMIIGGLNKTVNLMDDLLFDGNYLLSDRMSRNYDIKGGALYNSCTIKKLTNSTFTNNYIDTKGARNNNGGAIYTTGVIELIDNVIFKNNWINGYTSQVRGAAITLDGKNSSINLIKNSRFENNILHGEEGGSSMYGGAIYVTDSLGLGEISNSTFIGNGIIKNNGVWYQNTRGGAICFDTGDTTITNSIFRDNFVNWSTNEARERTTGGAIWANINLNIVATGEDGLTEFTGNYIQTKLVKESEAIFMNKAGSTLTLNANNNGRILFNDFINGIADGYLVNITGDNTGRLSLYNDIKNAAITAENINIDTADGKLFNYNFKSLDSKESAKYTIDIDYANQTADTFTLGEGSTGTILIDKINAIATSDKDYKIQILHAQDNSIQLALSDNIVSVYDIVGNLGNTVYSTDKFHQYEGLSTATTNTTNDSIYCISS